MDSAFCAGLHLAGDKGARASSCTEHPEIQFSKRPGEQIAYIFSVGNAATNLWRSIQFELSSPYRLYSSLGRYVFGSEISYNKAPPRLPGLGC